MSYTKPDGKIIFTYSKEDIFVQAQLRTSYRARNLKNDNGESQLDDYSMSDDEQDAFKVHLKDAIDVVLRRIRKSTAGAGDFLTETDTEISFTIKDKSAYNENSVIFVERIIRDVLIFGVIAGWYNMIGLDSEATRFQTELTRSEVELNNSLFQLRKSLLA